MVHENWLSLTENRAPMIRYRSQKQLTLDGFETPFQTELDPENRWIKLSECIPWDALAEGYYAGLSSDQGRPAKDARLVIGAVIIKHKQNHSDEETVQQIQENPYLQYFCGLPDFTNEPPFAPSLFVDIRKRMGQAVFESFHEAILGALEAERSPGKTKTDQCVEASPSAGETDPDDEDPPGSGDARQSGGMEEARGESTPRQGKLILDATVAEQAIRYPTDLSLLNEAREFSERIIDELYPSTGWKRKPRTYRQKARQAFLAVAKQRRPGTKVLRRAIKQQLQYLRRNLGHIARLMDTWPMGTPIPLPRWLMHRYWVIQHLYDQQWQMYRTNTRRCDDRIVSISQPHVRPIIRGKQNKAVEFGSKLASASMAKAWPGWTTCVGMPSTKGSIYRRRSRPTGAAMDTIPRWCWATHCTVLVTTAGISKNGVSDSPANPWGDRKKLPRRTPRNSSGLRPSGVRSISNASPSRASSARVRTATGSTTFGRNCRLPPRPGFTASSW